MENKPKTWGEKYEKALNIGDYIYQEYLSVFLHSNISQTKNNLRYINVDEEENRDDWKIINSNNDSKTRRPKQLKWNKRHNYEFINILKQQWAFFELQNFSWPEKKKIELKPGKYLVMRENGIQSRFGLSLNSEKVQLYPQHITLEIIKIQILALEFRVRGQIKKSLDWVSIRDTSDGYMWMMPILLNIEDNKKAATINDTSQSFIKTNKYENTQKILDLDTGMTEELSLKIPFPRRYSILNEESAQSTLRPSITHINWKVYDIKMKNAVDLRERLRSLINELANI